MRIFGTILAMATVLALLKIHQGDEQFMCEKYQLSANTQLQPFIMYFWVDFGK